MGIIKDFLHRKTVIFTAATLYNQLALCSDVEKAYILLMAASIKDNIKTLDLMVDHPTMFPKWECYAMFKALLHSRQESEVRLKEFKMANPSPSAAEYKHKVGCIMAMNLLMSTVGVGYESSTLGYVIKSWHGLASARPFISSALNEINNVHDRSTTKMDDETWKVSASSFPVFLIDEHSLSWAVG